MQIRIFEDPCLDHAGQCDNDEDGENGCSKRNHGFISLSIDDNQNEVICKDCFDGVFSKFTIICAGKGLIGEGCNRLAENDTEFTNGLCDPCHEVRPDGLYIDEDSDDPDARDRFSYLEYQLKNN